MLSARLASARLANRLLPAVLSNRLTLRFLYPFDRARRDGFEFKLRAVTGSFYHGTTAEAHAYMLGVHGYNDWRVVAVAGAVLRPGDVVLEVGANVGTETIAFADLVGPAGKVYALEPLPSNLPYLQRLNERSGLAQVEILPLAVSDTEGTAAFALPPDLAHSGIGHIVADGAKADGKTIDVPCTTLDRLFGDRGPIRLICIDAEGAESNILRGGMNCLERHKPVVIVEASARQLSRCGSNLGELHSLLRSQGYTVFSIGRLGLKQPDLASERVGNWLAIHGPTKRLVAAIHRRLFLCGVTPCIRGLNPLTRCPSI